MGKHFFDIEICVIFQIKTSCIFEGRFKMGDALFEKLNLNLILLKSSDVW